MAGVMGAVLLGGAVTPAGLGLPKRPRPAAQTSGRPFGTLSEAAGHTKYRIKVMRMATTTSQLGRELARAQPVPAAAVRAPFGAARDVLALQRAAGNAAVSALLTSVQRFEGPEHRALGDATLTTIDLGNGVVLSWGEMVALAGDEYPTLDKLLEDTRTEEGRQRLRAALEHDRIPGPHSQALPWPKDEQKQKDLRSERDMAFVLLAMQNIQHFAEGGAIESWQAAHTQALTEAVMAGVRGDAAGWEMAKAREAFGQHFLTDSFSGGHIRTPRKEIADWYTGTFAPRVALPFLDGLRDRIVDGLTAQVSPQTNWPDAFVRPKVRKAVDEILAEKLASIGGRAGFVNWFGLAVAGAVSGALHDLEGVCGVRVTSEAHPAPWQAYGDGSLERPPPGGEADVAISREQAELAVLTAHADLETANLIGRELYKTEGAGSRPERVHFGFDSDRLDGEAVAAVAGAAGYLDHNPEMRADLVGHTDPVGTDGYNDGLGLRRAQAVEQALVAAGAGSERLAVRSEGEHRLVTTEPRRYRLDRRVEFRWEARPGPWRDLVGEEAQQRVTARMPAPYPNVLRFVPHATAEGNVDIENWRWGQMPPEFASRVRDWIQQRVTADRIKGLLQTNALDDKVVEGYTVHPRPVIEGIANDFLANPMGFLERNFGQPASG